LRLDKTDRAEHDEAQTEAAAAAYLEGRFVSDTGGCGILWEHAGMSIDLSLDSDLDAEYVEVAEDPAYASLMAESVEFEVADEVFALPKERATVLGENLRLQAKERRDEYGSVGALAVADLIEDVLITRRTDPIPLEGEAAEGVLYALNLMVAIHGAEDDPDRRLYAALHRLHDDQSAAGG
jgi:hypothetical protein